MTIGSNVVKSGPYVGNGVATAYDYDFKITAQSELMVVRTVAGDDETLELTTDYTVSGVGVAEGGQVTFVEAPTASHTINITLRPEPVQNVDLGNTQRYDPETVETMADRLTNMVKGIYERLDRTVTLPINATPSEVEDLSTAIANAEGYATSASSDAGSAAASATAAATSAGEASTSATAAAASATSADASELDAETAATAAAAALATLQASFNGTSTSNVTPGTGSKVFTTEAGKAWYVGQPIRAINNAGDKFMDGIVASYSGTTLTITVSASDFYGGSAGTQWNIGVSGARGATGASGGGSGDVVGPASAVSTRLVQFSGTSGKLVADSGILTADVATTTYVTSAIDAVKNGVAGAYDTLAEIATAITTLIARNIIAGAGLTGGGTLAADRTLTVGAGTGITVNADDVAIDTTVVAV